MSTRLLAQPGKAHELCDDLESLWFVLLFEGLHYVKHNEPSGIDMELIFDQAKISFTSGDHTGGVGKRDLYGVGHDLMTKHLKFDSKPFTTLIREMYLCFRQFHLSHL